MAPKKKAKVWSVEVTHNHPDWQHYDKLFESVAGTGSDSSGFGGGQRSLFWYVGTEKAAYALADEMYKAAEKSRLSRCFVNVEDISRFGFKI